MMERTTTETGGENWWFWCPGCETHHLFTTRRGPGESGPVWELTGPIERPTFTPSLNCPDLGCHLTVTKGVVHYLSDCTHRFAGQFLPLAEVRFHPR